MTWVIVALVALVLILVFRSGSNSEGLLSDRESREVGRMAGEKATHFGMSWPFESDGDSFEAELLSEIKVDWQKRLTIACLGWASGAAATTMHESEAEVIMKILQERAESLFPDGTSLLDDFTRTVAPVSGGPSAWVPVIGAWVASPLTAVSDRATRGLLEDPAFYHRIGKAILGASSDWFGGALNIRA